MVNYKRRKELFNRMLVFSLLVNLFCMGALMNMITVSLNGGKMPVYTSDSFTTGDRHFLFTNPSEVNLFLFSDIMKLKLGESFVLFFSIGDVLVVGSILVMFSYLLTLLILDMNYVYNQVIKKMGRSAPSRKKTRLRTRPRR